MLDGQYVSRSDSLDAATSLKQIRLLLGVDQRLDEKGHARALVSQARPRISKLDYRSLLRESTGDDYMNRELAIYRSPRKNINSRVIVEWRKVEKVIEEKLKNRVRVLELTLLMSSITDPSFHSLKCLGFLQCEMKDSFNMYAYVFEIVNLNENDVPQSPPVVRSLSALITNIQTPSLTYRVRIDLALAETLLQLHTSGWLHKAISSENVLFVDLGTFEGEEGTSLGPYLAGNEYARVDSSQELTERVPSNPTSDLYRHPEAQGIVRFSFKKEFDLYALGCVLLEIGL